MKSRSEKDWESRREEILGLGTGSVRKSHYPNLRRRLAELERFRALMDVSYDLLFVVEVPSGRILDANRTACRRLGVECESLLDRSLVDLVSPDSQETVRQRLLGEKPLDNDAPLQADLVAHDGSRFATEIAIRLLPAGEQHDAVVSIRDVSERKLAEEELARTQALLMAAIEQTPAGIIIADAPDVSIRVANSAALGIRGETGEPLTDIPVDLHPRQWQTFYPDGTPCRAEDLPLSRAVLRGETVKNVDVIIRRPDGEDRWVLANAAPVRDSQGNTVAGVVVFPDVTERRQAEEALKHRLLALTGPVGGTEGLQFTDLFDLDEIQEIQDAFARATGVASIITEVDGRPITRPSNFCRLCEGIIRKTEKGFENCMHSDAVLGRPHPEGYACQPCLSGGLWDGGASICVGEEHIANWLIGQVLTEDAKEEEMVAYAQEIGADEDEFRAALAEVTRMPVEQFRRVARFLHIVAEQLSRLALQNVQQAREIAERKRAQEELALHRDHLEELVKERTHELEEAQEALVRQERLAALGQLTATVSHELRNPLGAIRTSSYLIGKRVRDPDPLVQRALDRVERGITRCDAIITDLLDYSRVKALQREPTDLTPWIASTLAEYELPPRVSLNVGLEADVRLPLDRERLRRCLINVLSNAWQAMEPSGGTLTVTTRLENGEVAIDFSDTGCGIPADQMQKVFEPLYSTKTFGVGLGLPIIRQIVQQHDGRFEIDSVVGRGTTVTIRLPLPEEQGDSR